MRDSAKEFFSHLHKTHLKPHGYTKLRHIFSRDMGSYTERVQFQGSNWSDPNCPLRFYINFGVEFHDLPPRSPCKDLPGTHCWTRIRHIAQNAPSHFDLPDNETSAFAAEIAAYLDYSSQQVAVKIPQIRKIYDEKKSPHLQMA